MLTKLHPLQVESQLENNNVSWRMKSDAVNAK